MPDLATVKAANLGCGAVCYLGNLANFAEFAEATKVMGAFWLRYNVQSPLRR